jgi:hypothetical protein
MGGFCNIQQHRETGVGGLWLKRRWRVRAPSVTLFKTFTFAGRNLTVIAFCRVYGTI